jgi:hypothetical protein
VPPPSPAQIAEAAYYRFLKRGGADGSAMADWLEAEQVLLWKQLGVDVE